MHRRVNGSKIRVATTAIQRGERLEFGFTVSGFGAACVSATAAGTLQNSVDAFEVLTECADFLVDRRDGGGGALGERIDLRANCGEVHVDSCQ